MYSIDQHHYNQVDIYLIYAELSTETLESLYNINQILYNINLILKKIPTYLIRQLDNIKTEYTGLAVSTYYRLFISKLLPDIDRILYMDIDMLVLKNLSSLWQTNFDGNFLIAVHDMQMIRKQEDWAKKLLGKDYNNYFNNGLLLINLKSYRENNILERLITFTRENYELIKYDDQDLFNVFFKGRIKYADLSYNYMPMYFETFPLPMQSISICHYCGEAAKPWKNHSYVDKNYSLLKNLYRKYKFSLDHIMKSNTKIKFFMDYGSNQNAFKNKIESVLMQRYANIEIYIIITDENNDPYLEDLCELFPWIHLISNKISNNSFLKKIRNYVVNDERTYIYSLMGNSFLDDEKVFDSQISLIEDLNLDLVVSTYKILKDGNYYFYSANGDSYSIANEDIVNYQNKEFELFNHFEGILIRESILYSQCFLDELSEKQLMENIFKLSTKKYYIDSHHWIKKI